MQCGQGKPFTVTSTNSKMGSVAVRSYEKGGVVTKPTLKDDKNDTGVTTYDKLPRGQKEEIDNRRRAAVKAAEDKPKRRMGDAVADIAALSPFAPRDSGGAQNSYSASRQKAIDVAKDRAEYKDLKSGPTKLFKVPKGTPGMSIDEMSSLRAFQIED
jgi:hypothetical protein